MNQCINASVHQYISTSVHQYMSRKDKKLLINTGSNEGKRCTQSDKRCKHLFDMVPTLRKLSLKAKRYSFKR